MQNGDHPPPLLRPPTPTPSSISHLPARDWNLIEFSTVSDHLFVRISSVGSLWWDRTYFDIRIWAAISSIKPGPKGLESQREFANQNLRYGLAMGDQTGSLGGSQVHASRRAKSIYKLTCDQLVSTCVRVAKRGKPCVDLRHERKSKT